MLKASQGNKTWAAQFGQLRRRWVPSGLEEELGDSNTGYQRWVKSAVRCPTLQHFRLFGQLLADIASVAQAPKSASAFATKFGSKHLPSYGAAVGLPGVPARRQTIESLQAFFDTRIYGRGLLSHKQYFQLVTANSNHLAERMSIDVSDMPVTKSVSDSEGAKESGGLLEVWRSVHCCW